MEATDRFGTYRVIQSRIDATVSTNPSLEIFHASNLIQGVWRCDHKYIGKESKKAYHVIFE